MLVNNQSEVGNGGDDGDDVDTVGIDNLDRNERARLGRQRQATSTQQDR